MKDYLILAALSSTVVAYYFVRQFFSKKYSCDEKLSGKTIVVTGSCSGIGKEAATEFARRGAKVILACRDIAKANETAREILKETGNFFVYPMELDLASFQSVRRFVEKLRQSTPRVDILVNNAGVFYTPRSETTDGFEIVFQVNYLGSFLLTLLCLDLLKKSPNGRIVNVSSHGHRLCLRIDFDDLNSEKSYGKFKVYSQSKAALILFTRVLSQKLSDTSITVNAVNPGNVDTQIFRHLPLLQNPYLRFIQWPTRKLIFKTVQDGTLPIIHCAIDPKINGVTGKYFDDFKEKETSPLTRDSEVAEKLWKLSLTFVGLEEAVIFDRC